MQLQELEFAAQIVFAMCRQHPELCPHSFEFKWAEEKEGTKVEHYECVLCGVEATREVEATENKKEVENVEE